MKYLQTTRRVIQLTGGPSMKNPLPSEPTNNDHGVRTKNSLRLWVVLLESGVAWRGVACSEFRTTTLHV